MDRSHPGIEYFLCTHSWSGDKSGLENKSRSGVLSRDKLKVCLRLTVEEVEVGRGKREL